jgi:hypothetical protein
MRYSTDPVAPYLVNALVVNCFLQGKIALGDDVEAAPLSESLAFSAEVDFALTCAAHLGANVTDDFADDIRRTVVDVEHVALLQFWDVNAESPEDAESIVATDLDQACDALSILTKNSVIPFALILNTGTSWSLRMLPPAEGRVFHFGPGMPAIMSRIYEKATVDPEYALLVRLFRLARQSRRPEFRIFQNVLALDIASEKYPGHLDKRIEQLMSSLGVSVTSYGAFSSLASDVEGAWTLMRFRHIIAHSGELTIASADQPNDTKFHGLLGDLQALADDVDSISRDVVAFLSRP